LLLNIKVCRQQFSELYKKSRPFCKIEQKVGDEAERTLDRPEGEEDGGRFLGLGSILRNRFGRNSNLVKLKFVGNCDHLWIGTNYLKIHNYCP
jgi:hypothetical protein